MKWLILLLLKLVLLNVAAFRGDFDFKISANDGGPDGFNLSNCSCNSLSNKHELELQDSGFSPIEVCCLEDFPEEAKKLYDELLKKVNANKTESSTLKRSGFVLWYDIKNSRNFEARIYKE